MSTTVISFGSKAETLERLAPVVTSARVLPQRRFSVADWRSDADAVITTILAAFDGPVIVRSSARAEDGAGASNAGRFTSVPSVQGSAALRDAIARVIASFPEGDPSDQVFVQPMLNGVRLAGVAFSIEPSSGAPYFVISYEQGSGGTDAVTSGRSSEIKTAYCHRSRRPVHAELAWVADLLVELEGVMARRALDVEFAVTAEGELVLLQVRPLDALMAGHDDGVHARVLSDVSERVERGLRRHPYLFGDRTVYGVMPDWNPAEIIGIRPRPLALSIYQDILTDSIWAYQRNNYGYRNLRSFPLMVNLAGLPYIDVRVSFNSFIPADVAPELAERLVNYYVQRLIESPGHHDKVEFEIIFSCYTLDLPDRLSALAAHGFTELDRRQLADSLRRFTNTIIHGESGLWRRDITKVNELERRRAEILASDLPKVAKIYWLLEDCKRYGTLPFAGLARAGFIAVQILQSLVATGVLSPGDYQRFMNSLETVGSRLSRDLARLSRDSFLAAYGHLRPGTYDILSPRYDEAPDRYFDWNEQRPEPVDPPAFGLSLPQLNRASQLLRDHGIDHDGVGLFNFLKAAIEGREYSKFMFTKSLSDALALFASLGADCGLDAEACSYADIMCIRELYGSSAAVSEVLERSIAAGRARYAITRELVLPPLIVSPADIWSFELTSAEPNFVTLKAAEGPVALASGDRGRLRGAVVLIPSADPGYDWLFSHGIASFITMYGGANSHMAIRAAELGIPAVIGAGEVLYGKWAAAARLEVDCAVRQVRIIQ